MTLQECLDKTRKLINYYSISGEIIDAQDPVQRDYSFRAFAAIDTAHKELAARRPLVRHLRFTQHILRPLDSLPGLHRVEGCVTLQARGAGAFSLMCDGAVTIEMEAENAGNWIDLCHISHTESGQMALVYATAPEEAVSADTPVRLCIKSDSAFVADAALYTAFPKNEEIPLLGARRFRALPVNFCRLLDCRPKGRLGHVMHTGFARVDNGKIGFPWDFDGVVQLEYTAHPQQIDNSSSLSTELELGPDTAEAVPFYAAAMLLTEENPKLSEFFLHAYTDKLRALETITGFRIQNHLFGGTER